MAPALLIALVVAACGGSGVGDDDAGGPGGDATTTTGGSSGAIDSDAFVRIAFAGPMTTLDPHKEVLPVQPTYHYPIYDRLFRLDDAENQSVVAMLAEEWSFSEDGSSLTVEMRDDVVFHDGSPVNALAVKESIERGQSLEDSTVAAALAGFAAVEVVDEHTVRFQLEGVGADAPAILATSAGAIINPAVLQDPSVDLDTAPPPAAGSGPYVVTSSEPNVQATYERAPQYWDQSRGRLAGFSVDFVAQATTRVSGLQARDFDLVHITGDATLTSREDVEAGRYEMVEVPAATRDLFLNVEAGNLGDLEIRRAISLAIDRSSIEEFQSCLPNTQPHFAGHWAFNPGIANEYDPQAATQIVEETGDASFTLAFAAGSAYEPVATVLQDQLTQVGIDVSLRPVEQAQTHSLFSAGEVDAILSSVTPGADPNDTLNRYFTGGPNIARGPVGDEIRQLALEGVGPNLSQDQRAVVYQDIFARIMDGYLYATICRTFHGWAHNSDTEFVADLENLPGIGIGSPDFTVLAVAAS